LKNNFKYKFVLVFLFLISGIFLLAGKISNIGRYLLVKELDEKNCSYGIRWGDLYKYSRVSSFSEIIHCVEPKNETDKISECEILLIGDSFFESPIGKGKFSNDLEDMISEKIFDITYFESYPAQNPYYFIKNLKSEDKKNKILILETSERLSYDRINNHYLKSEININISNTKEDIKQIFSFSKVDYLFDNANFTYNYVNFKSDLLFLIFERMHNNIPIYSYSNKMLFYKDEYEFYKKRFTDDEIQKTANNIKLLSDKLYYESGIILIFTIIPDKITLYNDLIESNIITPSGYLEKLYNEIEKQGVEIINSYKILSDCRGFEDPNLLYYRTDTHFNEAGKIIILNAFNEKIHQIKEINKIKKK